MSIIRSIEHPGVEIREIDISQITPTPVGTYFYLAGYTDKGEEYEPNIITSASNFSAIYGEPVTEAEKYLYYGVRNVVQNNGTAIVAKLPYENNLATNYKTLQIKFNTAEPLSATPLSGYQLSGAPYNYGDVAEIELYHNVEISREQFDTLKTGQWPDCIDSVDYSTSGIATSADFVIVNEKKAIYGGEEKNEGIFVVITDIIDGLNIQRMLPGPQDTDRLTALNSITCNFDAGNVTVPSGEYAVPLSGEYRDDSVSEWIMKNFPTVVYKEDGNALDNEYSQYMGVIVCRTHYNRNGGEKLSVEILEAHVGSIHSTRRNKATGHTEYISDIVNQNSSFIKMYGKASAYYDPNNSTISPSNIPNDDDSIILWNKFNDYYLLGFEPVNKIIKGEEISKYLNIAFDKVKNIHDYQIDVVVDAGLSSIAVFTSGGSLYTPPTNTRTWSDIDVENLRLWKCVASTIDTFCSKIRKDCMAIIDGPRHLVLEGNQKHIRKTMPTNVFSNTIGLKLRYITGLNSSYSAVYINWFAISDEFNGKSMWIPESLKVAGVYAYTDSVANIWDAPAGLNRGQVRGVYDLSFNPDAKDMDAIYTKSLNYAVKYPLDGFIIEGQKTSQAKPSAFDRVNVRRLFLRLERAVYGVSRYFVYEPNNLFTRRRLLDVITPMFQAVKSAGGLYDYKLICDETNNTPDVIDNNEMKVAILLKPVRTAEYILVDFVATRTDANFEEIAQQI